MGSIPRLLMTGMVALAATLVFSVSPLAPFHPVAADPQGPGVDTDLTAGAQNVRYFPLLLRSTPP